MREKEYLPPFPGSGRRSFHDTSCLPKPSPRPSGPSTALTPHQDSFSLKVPLALATPVTQLSTVPREVWGFLPEQWALDPPCHTPNHSILIFLIHFAGHSAGT